MSKNVEKTSSRVEFNRTQSLRLPTPPPDPTHTENEFFEYLNSLSTKSSTQGNRPIIHRVNSMFGPAIATEDAFDHLDKLYKLMEQLLNLREQNAKLQRKVRDLEHLRNLQKLDHQITSQVLRGEETELPDLDNDSVLAEALLDNMFTPNRSKRNSKYKYPSQFRFRQSILRSQREKNIFVATDVDPIFQNAQRNSRVLRKPSKVSKWTKVKAAFKWEKASQTVSDSKSQDSGIGGIIQGNHEDTKYLRVPSTSDNPTETGASPADSVLSGSWNAVHGLSTPGTLSPASSTDELNQSSIFDQHTSTDNNRSEKQYRTSRTSDEDEIEKRSQSLDFTSTSFENSQYNCKDDLSKFHSQKCYKTPWGKVKDIIQIRKDSLKKKQHRLSSRSDDCRTDYSAGSDQEDVFESSTSHTILDTPTVLITNSEDQRKEKERESENGWNAKKIPADVIARYQRVIVEDEKSQGKSNIESPRMQRRISKWTKVKKAFLTSTSLSRNDDEYKSNPTTPTIKYKHFFSDISPSINNEDSILHYKESQSNIEARKLKEEIYKNYEQLQQKLSQEFQEKLQEWEKVKMNNNAMSTITTTQIGSTNEEQPNSKFLRKMEEWEKIKFQNNCASNKVKNLQMTNEENLPPDFRKKLQEWQKMKKTVGREDDNLTSISRKKKGEWQLWRSNSSQKQETTVSLGQPNGRQYSEDFLKKLNEWKQIKASNLAGEIPKHRSSIKDNKSPSPNLIRKNSGSKLTRQNKNYKMQEWLEKELQKIEREKQRLEKERDKFLEQEERLTKLRRTINSNPHKRDVLVQTSTGFYRFEGISRKFTQRLYEWEKAKGIAPEASTFTLLNSGYNQLFPISQRIHNSNKHRNEPIIKLTRSKSVDSVANLTSIGSMITHQPSSLSLNDMEELEMQCLVDCQSDRNLNESEDNLDYGEPEAVIVEVEDVVEETAAPLESCIQENQYTPVYQTEGLTLCESEKCKSPEVRSAKVLINYDLIKEILNILYQIRNTVESYIVTESEIHQEREPMKNTGAIPKRSTKATKSSSSFQETLHKYYSQQTELVKELYKKIQELHEENMKRIKNLEHKRNENNIISIFEDLSHELVTIAGVLKSILYERSRKYNVEQKETILNLLNTKLTEDINENVNLLNFKINELKKYLSNICAISDMNISKNNRKRSYKERRSSSNKEKSVYTSDEEDLKKEKTKILKRKEKLVKSKSEDNQMLNYAKLQVTSFANHKKERAERSYHLNRSLKFSSQTHLNNQNIDKENIEGTTNFFSNEVSDSILKNKCKRKLIRTRRISDSEERVASESIEENSTQDVENCGVIIPTHIQYLDATVSAENKNVSNLPVSVFVDTTPKLFTPFALENLEKKNVTELSKLNDEDQKINHYSIHSPNSLPSLKTNNTANNNNFKTSQEDQSTENHSNLPPLPSSPITQRKYLSKETSPAIRLMIARYNQKLSEHESAGNRSAGSSGSASPVAWRSPVFERRVRAQTERYEEEVNKSLQNTGGYSPLFIRKQVQKSASAGVLLLAETKNITKINQPGTSLDSSEGNASPKLIQGILKSSSIGTIKSNPQNVVDSNENNTKITGKPSSLKLSIHPPIPPNPHKTDLANKLQKAKEEFLMQNVTPNPLSAPYTFEENKKSSIKYPAKNRLSQVSFGSESSCDEIKYAGLVKSASAGMINVDEATYEQFRPEIHSQGYVSLPRVTKKKDGKFGISSITSRFRKTKLKRSKDSTQMNTISTLCRQSLVVDITENTENQETDSNKKNSSASIEVPSTSSASSMSQWIKSPSKIFRPK